MRPMLRLETLESRDTPVDYFAAGNSLAIETAGGVSVNRPADAALVGATGAVLLRAGDRLLYDADGDNAVDPFDPHTGLGADRELVRVDAGRAVVFLRNFDGDIGHEPDEVSGLALSDGFRGTVGTDVRGDVATVLGPGDALTLAGLTAHVEFATIAGLTVDGRVAGDVLAGNRISNLAVGHNLFVPGTLPSAQVIATGSATDGRTVSFGGPGGFTADYTQPAAVAGGNISNVRLAAGCV